MAESLAPLISAMGDGRSLKDFCSPLAEYNFEVVFIDLLGYIRELV